MAFEIKDGILLKYIPEGEEKSIIIPDTVECIGHRAFQFCENFISVNIPKSVIKIGEESFGDCSALKEVIIPDSVTSIGEGAFSGCSNLKKIKISNSIKIIEDYTFLNCLSLKEIVIPNSVESIGIDAFGDCVSLKKVIVGNSLNIEYFNFSSCSSLTEIKVYKDNMQFSDVDGVLFNKDKTKLIIYPVGKAEESYVIPKTVKNIEDYAFFWLFEY